MTPAPVFTAAHLARALQRTKRAVLQALGGVPAAPLPGRGGEAKGYALRDLPADWREQLAAEAQRRGCRDAAHLLTAIAEGKGFAAPWQPLNAAGRIVPLSEVAAPWRDRAGKLRAALALPMARQHELERPALRELGLAEYRQAFGHAISGKHWERLFQRTVERDGGAENWTRLELYLDAPAFAQRAPKVSRASARFSHNELDSVIKAITDKNGPGVAVSVDDRDWLFHKAFRHFEQLNAAHNAERDQRTIKSTLLAHLLSALPALSRTPDALRRVFDLRLARWIAGGRTIDAQRDGRPGNSGRHRRPDFTADEKKIRNLAIELDGNESLAHQMLRERGALSPEFCTYYSHNPRVNKSYLAKTVRDNITNAVNFPLPLRRGERAFRASGPWTDGDYSNMKPGDWFNADDVTWNHYFKVRNAGGSWDVLRGECLLMADVKTDYPFDPLLIAGPYNSEHCVRLLKRAHDTVGLARKGTIYERGRWNGTLVKAQGAGALSLDDTFKAFAHAMPGFEIRRTYTPTGKPIEGMLHHLQDRMRCIFGFVGFNEQVEKREDIQKLIARARRGDEEALAQFLTQDEWTRKIVEVLDDFRHAPQNGKRLQGASPAEAWNAAMRDHPLEELEPDLRYLLSTHCKKARLGPPRRAGRGQRQGSPGIVLNIRGHRRCYANEHTGAWFAKGVSEVIAFYDVEQPDLLTVSDLNRTQRFTVKALALDRMAATREELAAVNALKRAHLAPARAIYGEIKHAVVSKITRDNLHTDVDREEGRFIAEASERHRTEETAERKTMRRISALCDELGEREPDFTTERAPLHRLLESLERKAARHRKSQPA